MIRTLVKCDGTSANSCQLTFSHPEVSHRITDAGIPQVNLDQLNPRDIMLRPEVCTVTMVVMSSGTFVPDHPHNGLILVTNSGGVLNKKLRAMKLTRGKLHRGGEWEEWHSLEWKQLNQ